uniref:UPAR/Ly6 domain-containing protein n=1 Tax=Scleropages formosus TaxID=113540 RepID=A0A8C9SKJ6_SCLFO
MIKCCAFPFPFLSFLTADALKCNTCSVGLFGYCFFGSTATCSSNQTSCYTSNAAFTGVSGFSGFATQGCYSGSSPGCNSSYTGTILSATYVVTTTCCSTDNCNPITNGAPGVKVSLTVATSAALLASVWIKLMY